MSNEPSLDDLKEAASHLPEKEQAKLAWDALINHPLVQAMEETVRIRKPDDDLEAYLNYNTDIYALEDIANIHAEVPGHNDDDYWHWIIELKDRRFVYTSAWCDYTGWDCQSGGESKVASSALEAAELAPEEEYRRFIRRNLVAQLKGEQPFGVEVIPASEED